MIYMMIVKDNSVSYDSPYEVRGDPRRLALVRLHFPLSKRVFADVKI